MPARNKYMAVCTNAGCMVGLKYMLINSVSWLMMPQTPTHAIITRIKIKTSTIFDYNNNFSVGPNVGIMFSLILHKRPEDKLICRDVFK